VRKTALIGAIGSAIRVAMSRPFCRGRREKFRKFRFIIIIWSLPPYYTRCVYVSKDCGTSRMETKQLVYIYITGSTRTSEEIGETRARVCGVSLYTSFPVLNHCTVLSAEVYEPNYRRKIASLQRSIYNYILLYTQSDAWTDRKIFERRVRCRLHK